MGLFGNLFNPSKWSLSTLGDVAGLAGGAITGGLLPGSQALGLGLSAAGGLFGSNSSGNVPTTYTPGTQEDLLKRLGMGDLQFAMNNQGKRHQAINNAANALDPRNDSQNAGYFQNSLLRNADMQGRRNANDLQRRGYGSGVADAARLDARNNAVMQGNDYFASLRNPMNQAQRYGAQADLYGNTGLFANTLTGQISLQNQSNAQRLQDLNYYNNAPASGLESLLGLASQFAPFMSQKKSNQSGGKIYDQPIGPGMVNFGNMRGGLF